MNIENLCMSFGTQVIFDNASVIFGPLDKIGIIGVNGAGKSTLFKIILKELEPQSGIISCPKESIGYLPQVITDEIPSSDISVFDYLLEGRPIKELHQELNGLYEKIAIETNDSKLKPLMKRIDAINNLLTYYEEYEAESILLKILNGMNIDNELLYLKLSNLSGGQKSKIAFARLLYSKKEVLLLDEPTNHLDKDTKDYIINYLKNYKGLVLIISHDKDFLNEITNKTLYVDKQKHNFTLYNGNYDKYIKIKNENDLTKQRLYEKQVKEEEKLKNIISKYIAGNEKKANIAKDRQKKLEKLLKDKVELEKKNKVARFKIEIDYPSYSVPLRCNNITFGYKDGDLLYENLFFELNRGEKFLVVGENGIGKTTLLKLIMGILQPIEGSIDISEKTTLGYYAQEHEILDANKTILENFKDSGMEDYEIRRFMGSFLFSGDDVFKKVSILSPGERARVALAKIALLKANTLLLDEPTNHLDPMMQVLIADIFKNFEGTMLVISHNLEFVDNLGIDRMLLLPSGRITYYDKNIVMYYESINEK